MRQDILLDLADRAQSAENSLVKARVLCGELCEEYFSYVGKPTEPANGTKDGKQNFILWEYGHYAVYAHILQDYLLQAEEGVQDLSLLLRDYINLIKENGRLVPDILPRDKKQA